MARSNDKKPKAAPRGEPRDTTDLRRRLSTRERQLSELTEHSLRILDELATARQQPSDQSAMKQRIAALEAALADVRQRLRNGSRAILTTANEGSLEQVEADVVVWGFRHEVAEDLETALAGLGSLPTTVLMGQNHRAESFVSAAKHGWSVHESSCLRPSHYWNQAMAATTKDVVVFVAAGLSIDADSIGRLVDAARCAGVAVSCPKVMRSDLSFLGRSEQGILEVRAMPLSEDGTPGVVPFASPEAFALSREAFESVGPFDQDLGTELALAEWTLRATALSLRVVGVASAKAQVASRTEDAPLALAESDRLVVLARHRPHQLMAAALASEALWSGDSDSLAATIRAALQRLPRANEFPGAIEVLVHQAQTLASYQRVVPTLRDRVASLCRELKIPSDPASAVVALPSLVERATSMIGTLRQQAETAVRAVQEADAAKREHQQAVARHVAVERELKDGMLARSGTIDALRNELLERERAIASLRQDLGHRKGESQRFVDHLAEQQQTILDLQEKAARDKAELERLADIESKCRVAEEQVALLRDDMASHLRTVYAADAGRVESAIRESHEMRMRAKELEAQVEALRSELQEGIESRMAKEDAASRKDSELEGALAAAVQKAELAEIARQSAQSRAEEAESMSKAAGARAFGLEARIRTADMRIQSLEAAVEEAKESSAQHAAILSARIESQAEVIRGLETRLSEAMDASRAVEGKLEAESSKGAELDRVRLRLEAELTNVRKELQSSQQAVREASAKRGAAESRADETSRMLAEREEWICLLLHEVCQRRVIPRDLLPHEQEFLAKHAKLLKP